MINDKFKITCPLCDEIVFKSELITDEKNPMQKPFCGIVVHLRQWHRLVVEPAQLKMWDQDRDPKVTEEIILQLGINKTFAA